MARELKCLTYLERLRRRQREGDMKLTSDGEDMNLWETRMKNIKNLTSRSKRKNSGSGWWGLAKLLRKH